MAMAPRIGPLICCLLCLSWPVLAASPLPPGKPGGVRAAQQSDEDMIFIGAVIVIAAVGLGLAATRYQIPGASSTTSTQGP